MTRPDEDSLFLRLGGSDGIARIVTRWIEEMKRDPEMRTFHGVNAAQEKELTQAAVAYLTAASGGPGDKARSAQWVGRWSIMLMSDFREKGAGYLMEALASEGISDVVKGEVISCMTGMGNEILRSRSVGE